MKPKRKLTTQTVSEKLVLFMHRFAYSQKEVARIVDIPRTTLSNRIKNNNWHLDEIRSLNNKLTLQRGLKL